MADLITQEYLTAALADYGLTANQTSQLPALAAGASRLVRDWCNWKFTRTTYDELYSVGLRQPVFLREYPVNAISLLATNPTTVFSVTNTNTTTNQRATAALATTGSSYAGLVVTGLTLSRVASGVTTTSTLLFSASVTLDALALAVIALGGGWTATVSTGYGLWPTADLRAVQGALPALATRSAEFSIHVDELPFDLEPDTGILTIGSGASDSFDSPRWGPTQTSDFGDQSLRASPNNVRVIYDAGYDVIPECVQLACVELVKAQLERFSTDSTLTSETDGTYSWTGRASIEALPMSVLQPLALHRRMGA